MANDVDYIDYIDYILKTIKEDHGFEEFADILAQLDPKELLAFAEVWAWQGPNIPKMTKKWAGQIHSLEEMRAKLQDWKDRGILPP